MTTKTAAVDPDGTTISLDHVQRLNLVMLLGNLEANVGEMRALWKLLDTISLTPEEEYSIGFFTRNINGNEVRGWDTSKSLPVREYQLSEGDVARIRKALEQYPRHRVATARPWLEPLLVQAPQLLDGGGISRNGSR